MYGIDLKKMLDDIIGDSEHYKTYKHFIIFVTDEIKEVDCILTSLVNLYGDYFIDEYNAYEFNYFKVDIRVAGKDNKHYSRNLVAMHCQVMYYIYTKFDKRILPELLPCLTRNGKFITISKEPTGNDKPTCNEIVNDIIKNREDDISEIECLFNTWHATSKYKLGEKTND